VPQPLATTVLNYIRRLDLVRAGDRLAIACSGGADSVALLRILLELRGELGSVLSVAHLNHGIRGAAADEDEQFVRDLAFRYGLELHSDRVDTPSHAAEKRQSLETAARELRYGFFERLMRRGAVNKIATAHTQHDQAETVLMRVARGTGTRGLAGIHPRIELVRDAGTFRCEVVRPLLRTRRSELVSYLRDLDQPWREDATNLDQHHTRNRVRHTLLPLLEREFNPAVVERLSELAEIARAEDDVWRDRMPALGEQGSEEAGARIAIDRILEQPIAVQRRMLRGLGEACGITMDFAEVERVLALVRGDVQSSVDLHDGWLAERAYRELRIERRQSSEQRDFEYNLPVPGEVEVPELGRRFVAEPCPADSPDALDASLLGDSLLVRNWRAGDRFWPLYSKSEKKVKELLAQKHVSGRERALWPVATSNGQIAWMSGFPVGKRFAAVPGTASAVRVVERSPVEG